MEKEGIFKGIYSEEERFKLFKKELKRLNSYCKNIADDKKAVLEKLIEDAAFQAVTLDEAKQILRRDGIIDTYRNGATQYGQKKSAVFEVYDKLSNTYLKVIKQISDIMFPSGSNNNNTGGNEDAKALAKFMMNGRK